MPFKSKAQWRACFAADDPNWDCSEMAHSTPSYKKLPKKKKKEKKAANIDVDIAQLKARAQALLDKAEADYAAAFPAPAPSKAGLPGWAKTLAIGAGVPLAGYGLYKLLAPEKEKKANIDALLAAKKESDRKNYSAKHDILRKLISQNPANFIIDSAKGNISGITHTPTGFQIHMPSDTIPSGVALKQAAEKKPEDDVYVQSAVPSNVLDTVRKHGLLSSQALMNNPESLTAFLANRAGTEWDEDEETFKKRITEKLKDSFFSDSARGPSVFFGDPDPEKITDAHPSRKLKTEPIRVNLSKLLQAQPKTRISGSELQPYDPEGPKHQGDLRHYDIDIDKVREYAATAPKELWKHYNDPEGVRYAGNVPHAQIVTPSGSIAPEYLDFGDKEKKAAEKQESSATTPGAIQTTHSPISTKSASTMLSHFLSDSFNQRINGVTSGIFKENAYGVPTRNATSLIRQTPDPLGSVTDPVNPAIPAVQPQTPGIAGTDPAETANVKAVAQSFVRPKEGVRPNAAAPTQTAHAPNSEVAPDFGMGSFAGGNEPPTGFSLQNSQFGAGAGVSKPLTVTASLNSLVAGSTLFINQGSKNV